MSCVTSATRRCAEPARRSTSRRRLASRSSGRRGSQAIPIRDELFAKAMVLSDGTTTVAIVSADLLYTPLEEITGPVRATIGEKTGIPPQNIMVCATHTHSGPEVFTRSKIPAEGRLPASQIDQSYLQVLVRKMADSVLIAHQNMQDVRIGTTIGTLPEVHYNRRPVTEAGLVENDVHHTRGTRRDPEGGDPQRRPHQGGVHPPAGRSPTGVRRDRSRRWRPANGGCRRPRHRLADRVRLSSGLHLPPSEHDGIGRLSRCCHKGCGTGRRGNEPLSARARGERRPPPAGRKALRTTGQGARGRGTEKAPDDSHLGRHRLESRHKGGNASVQSRRQTRNISPRRFRP